MLLPDFIKRRQSALFVATGNSNECVGDWLPHFQAVVVHQQALLAVPGPIDFMTCITWEPVLASREEFHRVKTFLCAEPLSGSGDQNITRTIEEVGIPLDRAVTWPRKFYACRLDSAFEAVTAGIPYMGWGSAVTIHLLALFGYRDIFCLGHCDREGVVPSVYRGMRDGCDFAAVAVAQKFGCRVGFWEPGMTPADWRAT